MWGICPAGFVIYPHEGWDALRVALTDTAVRRAKPTTRPYKFDDPGGLYLAVMPGGGKLWRWKYRFDRKEKTMAFGSYPDVTW
jgi:hypothetical protein